MVIERADIRPYKTRERTREADLEGHLETVDKKGNNVDKDSNIENLYGDNQLYEAVNLLKGFHLLGSH